MKNEQREEEGRPKEGADAVVVSSSPSPSPHSASNASGSAVGDDEVAGVRAHGEEDLTATSSASSSPTTATNGPLESLTRLADALARLNLDVYEDDDDDAPPTARDPPIHRRSTTISHWRSLPPSVESAYRALDDAASHLHHASTKYALVARAASSPGGGDRDDSAVDDLALELLGGAEHVGSGCLLLFSPASGSSRSLRKFVKQYVRGVVSSVISLVRHFEMRRGGGGGGGVVGVDDDDDAGARRAGAVWDSCDKLSGALPRGNRSAMRRELLVWVKDCNESIEEFEGILGSSPTTTRDHDEDGNDDDDDDDDDYEEEEAEELYAITEMAVARASVNVMKCSKNVLNLVMAACECVGERAEASTSSIDCDERDDGAATTKRKGALRYITDLHDNARSVGEGVTDLGVLLYPPLDFASMTISNDGDGGTSADDGGVVPRLGRTALGRKLECQLRAISDCLASIAHADLSTEVICEAERLMGAVRVRSREVEEAIAVVDSPNDPCMNSNVNKSI